MTQPRRRQRNQLEQEPEPVPVPVRVAEAIIRIETKLDIQISGHEDHERRIRSLEQFRWALPSAATLLAVAGLLVAILKP